MQNDIFELAKQTDIVSYLDSVYNIKVGSKPTHCPLCGPNKTPSFTKMSSAPVVKCHKCMSKATNIIDFVMLKENLNHIEATKKICADMGYILDDGLSDEERAKRQKELEKKRVKLKAEYEAREKREQEEAKRLKQDARVLMKNQAPRLIELAKLEQNKEKFKHLFNFSDMLTAWSEYIGYSPEHDSVCIVNQDTSKDEIYNIKYRQKFIYDSKNKCLSDERIAGKWISQSHCTTHPFPFEYFKTHDDNKVVVCFGDKDALNLLSLGVNTLTLGGISMSFEPWAEEFKGKDVYIFPDNQLVEYEASLRVYKELKAYAKDIHIVSFFHIDKSLKSGYDVSDFILDKKLKRKEDFFELIKFAIFKPTNDFIDEALLFYPKDERLEQKLLSYKTEVKKEDFSTVSKRLLKDIPAIKGDLDELIRSCELSLQALRDSKYKNKFLKVLDGDEKGEVFLNALKTALKKEQRLYDSFKKQHLADVAIAFIEGAKQNNCDITTLRRGLYVWTGTHHLKIDDKEFKTFLIQSWAKVAKIPIKQQTSDFITKLVNDIYLRGFALDNIRAEQKARVINFLNGTAYLYENGHFSFKNGHDISDACINMLEFDFNKNATAPKWQSFLDDVLPNRTEQEALMEFIGYCFYPSHSFQKFLFLLGGGANGKSIVLNVIRKFFGKNISNLDIQQLAKHELVGIEGKYINIGSEIKSTGLNDGQLENLKKLTAGEPVQIDPKNAPPYDIDKHDIPKMIFAGNAKIAGNLDGGIFRRNLLLNFDAQIPEEKQIKNLEDRFNDELSGIFNMALKGLMRLLRRGKFSMSEDMVKALDEYKEEANPVLAYANENLSVDSEMMISKKLLYLHYKAWAEERGHNQMSERNFFGRIKAIFKDTGYTQPKYEAKYCEFIGQRPRFITGLRISREQINTITHNKLDILTEEMNVSIKLKVPISLIYEEE